MNDLTKKVKDIKRICPNSDNVYLNGNNEIIIKPNVFTVQLLMLLDYCHSNRMVFYMSGEGLVCYESNEGVMSVNALSYMKI